MDSKQGPHCTASGREIKKIGMNEQKQQALARLREVREGGVKRTDQYQVNKTLSDNNMIQVDEGRKIFEEVGDEEYDKRQKDRVNDEFIVDDEGYGYRDHGGEIWECDQDNEDGAKKKKRKIDVSETLNS